MNVRDFYAGFEGEPEIRFIDSDSDYAKVYIKMWEGYFSALLDAISPNPGGWTGLALPYQLHEGWYDGTWEIPDLNLCHSQISGIDITAIDESMRETASEIRTQLLAIVESCINRGDTLFIRYE